MNEDKDDFEAEEEDLSESVEFSEEMSDEESVDGNFDFWSIQLKTNKKGQTEKNDFYSFCK